MSTVLDIVTSSGILLLVVVGLWVVLTLLEVINLALMGFMAVGVYLTVTVADGAGSLWIGMAAGVAGTAALGTIVEWAIVRRLYGRPLDTILATWGISLIVVQALSLIYGRGPKNLDDPLAGHHWLGYPSYRLLIAIVAVAVVLALLAVMRFTRVGLMLRTIVSNEELARGAGIDTTRARQLTFIAAAGLAGLAGAVLGPTQSINPNYAILFLGSAFLAVLLAGRSLLGLALGCLAIGVTQTLVSTYLDGRYATVAVIALAVVILRYKPEGLQWQRA
jgi:urea transport system permease protein